MKSVSALRNKGPDDTVGIEAHNDNHSRISYASFDNTYVIGRNNSLTY
ncbi:hypothetical protein [Bacillus mycoides]|nr:hypothetical protein [Bacillus mycoides]